MEIDVISRGGSTVQSISAVHVLVVGTGSLVWRTRTDEEFLSRNVGHIDIQRTVQHCGTIFDQRAEAVAGGTPSLFAEDGTLGQVVVGGPVVIALHLLSFIGSLIVLLLLSINIGKRESLARI